MNNFMPVKRKKAFTLVEVLLVVVIIGLLFVLIVTRLNNSTDRARLTGVQNDFKAWQTACELTAQENSGFLSLVRTSDPDNPDITKDNPDLSKLVEALNKNLDSEYKLYIVSEDNDGYGRKKYEIASDKTDPWNEVYRIEYRHEEGVDASGVVWKLDEGVLIFTSVNADLVYKTKDDYVMVCSYEAAGEAFEMKTRMDAYDYIICGHTWTWEHIKDATCEEYGYDKGTCSACKAEQYRMLEPLGHNPGPVIRTDPATCEDTGADYYNCTRCGKEFAVTIPALGHVPVETAGQEPTCVDVGWTSYSDCSRCGKVLEGKVIRPALGHLFDQPPIVVDATCTQPGSVKRTCSRCGYEESDVTLPLGHDWGDWHVTRPATSTTPGEEKRECKRCGIEDTKEIPISIPDHTCTYDWKIIQTPTCILDGLRHGECPICHNTKDETIPATGHDWKEIASAIQATCTTDGCNATFECNNCHEKKGGEIIRALGHDIETIGIIYESCTEDGVTAGTRCKRAGCTFRNGCDTIPATGHNFSDLIDHQDPTEDNDGFDLYQCVNKHGGVRCTETHKVILPAIGHTHSWSDWKQTKAPTCTDKGKEARTCTCGEVETRDVDAYGHDWKSIAAVAATCTEAGNKAGRKCNRCLLIEGCEKVEALGHLKGSSVIENYVAPTFDSEGGYDNVWYCEREKADRTKCGYEIEREHITLEKSDKINLRGCTVVIDPIEYTYDGTPKTPSVTVYEDSSKTVVVPSKYYSFGYYDNLYPNGYTVDYSPRVFIQAKEGVANNPYTGDNTAYFTIKKISWPVVADPIEGLPVYHQQVINLIIDDGHYTPDPSHPIDYNPNDSNIVQMTGDGGTVEGQKAGSTNVHIIIPGDGIHDETSVDVPVTVVPAMLPPDAVEDEDPYPTVENEVHVQVIATDATYDGAEHPATVIVTLNGHIIPASEYTVQYLNTKTGYTTLNSLGTDGVKAYTYAGNIKVVVTAKAGSKYLDGLSVTEEGYYEIKPAPTSLKITKSGVDYSGKTVQLDLNTSANLDLTVSPSSQKSNVNCTSDTPASVSVTWTASSARVQVQGISACSEATITCYISGSRNYDGSSVSFKVKVSAKDINDSSITVSSSPSYTYDGTEKKPTTTDIVLKDNGVVIPDSNYTVTGFRCNILPAYGTYQPQVKITGKNNYTGDRWVNFTINKIDLSAFNVKILIDTSNCKYTGAKQTPPVYVVVCPSDTTIKTAKLVTSGLTSVPSFVTSKMTGYTVTIETENDVLTNTQYNVAYSNNQNAGSSSSSTVSASSGSRILKNSATVSFTIEPADLYLIADDVTVWPGVTRYVGNRNNGLQIGIKIGDTVYVGYTNDPDNPQPVPYGSTNTDYTPYSITTSTLTFLQGSTKVTEYASATFITENSHPNIKIYGKKATASGPISLILRIAFVGSSNFNNYTGSVNVTVEKAPSQQDDTIEIAPQIGWYAEIKPGQADHGDDDFFYTGHIITPAVVVKLADGTEVTSGYRPQYDDEAFENTEIGEGTIRIVADGTNPYIKGEYILHFNILGPARLTTGIEFIKKAKTAALYNLDNIQTVKFGYWNSVYEEMFGAYNAKGKGNDVSELQDGRIRVFYSDNTLYVLATEYAGKWVALDPEHHYGFMANVNASSAFGSSDTINNYGSFNNVTTIDVSAIDFSRTQYMSEFFYKCSRLKTIVFNKNVDTSQVTSFSSFMEGCAMMTTVDLSMLKTNSAMQMGRFFKDCMYLSTLNINGWDTSRVMNMESMFMNCRNLKALDISGFNMQTVTDISHMLDSCVSLTEFNMHNSTKSLQDCSYMFNNCSALEWIDIGSFGSQYLNSMTDMFSDCTSLQVIFADKDPVYSESIWNTANMSDPIWRMFASCNFLTGGMGSTLSNQLVWSPMGYQSFQYFRIDNESEKGYLTDNKVLLAQGPDFNDTIKDMVTSLSNVKHVRFLSYAQYKANFAALAQAWSQGTPVDVNWVGLVRAFNIGGDTIIICPHPHLNKIYINPNAKSMFKNMGLTELPTYEGLTVSWELVENMTSCFSGTLISDGTYSSSKALNTKNCKSFQKVFQSCAKLTSFDFRLFLFNSAEDLSYMFDGCNELVEVSHTSTATTGNVKDFGYMFYNCSSLTSGSFYLNTSSATSFLAMFRGCTSLTIFDPDPYDSGVTWKTSKVESMSSMFYGCTNLTIVDLSGFSNARLSTIGYMFYNDSKLEKVYVSNPLWDNSRCKGYGSNYPIGYNTSLAPDGGYGGNNVFTNCKALIGGTATDYTAWDSTGEKIITALRAVANNWTLKDPSNSKYIKGYFTLKGVEYVPQNSATLEPANDNGDGIADVINNRGWRSDIVHIVIGRWSIICRGNSSRQTAFTNGIDVSVEKNNSIKMFNEYKNSEMTVFIVFDDSNSRYDEPMYFNENSASLFCNLPKLKDVKVDHSIANGEKIATVAHMFENDPELDYVELEWMADANDVMTDASYMFAKDKKLPSIDLGTFTGESLQTMCEMFSNCEKLRYVTMTSFHFNGNAITAKMFCNDKSLYHVYVGKDVGRSTTDSIMSDKMFDECVSIVGSQGTTYASSMVDGRRGLIDGADSNGVYPPASGNGLNGYLYYVENNAAAVLSAGPVFNKLISDKGWKNVTEVVFETYATYTSISTRSWNDDHVNVDINQFGSIRAFKVTESSKTVLHIVVGSGYSNIYANPNCEDMFKEFTSLTTIKWGNLVTEGMKSGSNYVVLSGVIVSGYITSTFETGQVTMTPVEYISGMFAGDTQLKFAGTGTTLTYFDMSALYLGNVHYAQNTFANCSSLAKVVLTNSTMQERKLNGLGNGTAVSYQGMFSNCSGLTSIDSEHIWFAYVDDASDMFASTKISTITLVSSGNSDFNSPYSPTVKGMFRGCASLTTVTGSLNTSRVVTMSDMFSGCTALKQIGSTANVIDLSWMNTRAVTHEDNMFKGDIAITSVKFANTGTSYDNTNFRNDSIVSCVSMFEGCKNLKTLTGFECVVNSKTDVTGGHAAQSTLTDCSAMFKGCTSLKNINLTKFSTCTEGLQLKLNCFDMFGGCVGLKITWNENATFGRGLIFRPAFVNTPEFRISSSYTYDSSAEIVTVHQ